MMSVYHECFTIHSKMQVTFDDVTERVLEAVASSKIRSVFPAYKLQRADTGGFGRYDL